ncbi:sulfate transporter family-domain-containing protein [Syncephalis fuscata]|nr:sulfate transporter family-domain-containing protein [Syncephalis fuscata]
MAKFCVFALSLSYLLLTLARSFVRSLLVHLLFVGGSSYSYCVLKHLAHSPAHTHPHHTCNRSHSRFFKPSFVYSGTCPNNMPEQQQQQQQQHSDENKSTPTPPLSSSVPSSPAAVPASLDPLQELAALRPERSDFALHVQRAQRRLRKAAFTRSHYSAHGQVHASDFPDYSLPQNDLRQQSVAIGGLEIRMPGNNGDHRINRPISAGDGLSISMPVRMNDDYLPLRNYATSDAVTTSRPSRLPFMRTNTNTSLQSNATTGNLDDSVGRERRTSDYWWQFPGLLSSSERTRTRVTRPGGGNGLDTHDDTSIDSDSDIASMEGDFEDDVMGHGYADYVNISGLAETESGEFHDAMERAERNPLLDAHPGYAGYNAISLPWNPRGARKTRSNTPEVLRTLVKSAPAVIVGTIINVLNAVSYGMIIFPLAISIFSDFALDGVALYLISSIVSQLVYSLGGSAFPGAVGGMILEVAPFLHAIAFIVLEEVGDKNPSVVTATTMIAYAGSAIVTGIVFLLMGYFKLGSLIGFFPRHILVGCIGGVGWFLVQTGIEVACGVNLEHDSWSELFTSRAIPLWSTGVLLAITLQMLLHRTNHPLTVPGFLLCIPLVFYIISGSLGIDMDQLRENGWLFKLPSPMKPFYEVYQRFDFTNVQWSTLPKTFPAMLALTFFSILHVPINVPALSVTIAQDGVDLSHELLAHGVSNILSGLCGSVQNYLVYSNSVLFIRCGGNSRVAGIALALCTLMAFFMGPAMIAFVPVIVVASLIFHLGIELLKEALYHPWGRVHPLEYATMVAIILSMATIGFIEGVLVGSFLACVFFVVLYSNDVPAVRRPVRQRQYLDELGEQVHLFELQGFLFFGTVNALEETVERIVTGKAAQLSDQTTLPVEPHRASHTALGPIARFIIMDFSLVTGLDFSAAEALVRVKRVLASNDVCLVVAGVAADSDIGHALQSMCSTNARTAQQAMEWCENQLLKCYYDHAEELNNVLRPPPVDPIMMQLSNSRQAEDTDNEPLQFGMMTPRTEMIAEAARYLLPDDTASTIDDQGRTGNTPRALLCMALARDLRSSTILPQDLMNDTNGDDDNLDNPLDFESIALNTIAMSFTRCFLRRGQIVWQADSIPDSIYLLDRGTLVLLENTDTQQQQPPSYEQSISAQPLNYNAINTIHEHQSYRHNSSSGTFDVQYDPLQAISRGEATVVETILPGALTGSAGLITGRPSPYHLVADSDATVWRLSATAYRQLCHQHPNIALWLVSSLMTLHTGDRFVRH